MWSECVAQSSKRSSGDGEFDMDMVMSSLARRLTGRTRPSSAGIRYGAHRRASGECISVAARARLQNAERSIAHSPLEWDAALASGARCSALERDAPPLERDAAACSCELGACVGPRHAPCWRASFTALRPLTIFCIKNNRIAHKSRAATRTLPGLHHRRRWARLDLFPLHQHIRWLRAHQIHDLLHDSLATVLLRLVQLPRSRGAVRRAGGAGQGCAERACAPAQIGSTRRRRRSRSRPCRPQ